MTDSRHPDEARDERRSTMLEVARAVVGSRDLAARLDVILDRMSVLLGASRVGVAAAEQTQNLPPTIVRRARRLGDRLVLDHG